MLIFFISVGTALVASHMCSLLEAALLSLSPSQLADIRQRNSKIGEICRKLKSNIEQSIAVILIINTAAHTIGAAVAGAAFDAMFQGKYLWIFSLVFTLLMVQYTEILPKTIGVRFNREVMYYSARTLRGMVILLCPLIRLVHFFNRPFERGLHADDVPSTAEEISALAAVARSSQQISSRQERIIKAVPRLSERTAAQVMLPVENISFLSTAQTMVEAMNATQTDFHTRYPVCDGDRNKVVGYVNFKELIATYRANPEKAKLADIVRPISFAAPEDTAADLLERFASQHCHMTVVRDAAGKTLGLLTLEDIVEELLGDLDDEFDPLPRTFYSPTDGFWVIGGGLSMSMIAREAHLDLPVRAEPVSNWFARMLKRPPRVGDVYRHKQVEFYARKIRRGRVLEFNMKKIQEQTTTVNQG